VAKAKKKLDKRLKAALRSDDDVAALHRARKAGKRFRYAAELATPVMGKAASKAVKAGKKLQKKLGEHQDSVVCAEFLRTLGARAGVTEDQNGFTYGLLLAREWERAADIRKKLRKHNA
jgi:CHAD domain-containing protein